MLNSPTSVAPALKCADRALYYSAAAQVDNLGDVVIRRTVLGWITASVADVHVYRGRMSDEYISAMEMPDAVTVHQSSRSFTQAWIRSCSQRRADLVFAPGPRVTTRSAGSTRSAAQLLAMASLTRSSAGSVLGVGGAIRGGRSIALHLQQLTATVCTDYSVRDQLSKELLKGRARLIPDVGFFGSHPICTVPDEPVLAISLRFDRPIDSAVLGTIIRRARRAGVEPVIVTQVRRDQPNHDQLAADLGVELCGWTTQSHREQLDRIEAIYRRSVAVFSDRLHACVLGGRHGAVVINAEPAGKDKLKSTLGSVYPGDRLVAQVEPLLHIISQPDFFKDLISNRSHYCARVELAAETLDRERSRLAGTLTREIVPSSRPADQVAPLGERAIVPHSARRTP